jgi:hypothetical protein
MVYVTAQLAAGLVGGGLVRVGVGIDVDERVGVSEAGASVRVGELVREGRRVGVRVRVAVRLGVGDAGAGELVRVGEADAAAEVFESVADRAQVGEGVRIPAACSTPQARRPFR